MFERILVPLDGSAFGEQALRLATGLARRCHATIYVVKVHVPPPLPTKGSRLYDPAVDQEARGTEASYLTQIADSIRDTNGLRVETALLSGDVVPALEDFVRERAISLVVMTTHGRGGWSRAWFGSVADALIRHLDVPVLMLRPESAGRPGSGDLHFDHVLVPVDGSALSELAIPEATELGELFGARYTLLEVVLPPFGIMPDAIAPVVVYQPDIEVLRSDASAYLDRLAAPLRASGREVDTAVVIQPQAAAGILEEAVTRRADLIVMSSHGRSGWRRYALGSVADKVLRGASVPVLMFRAGVQAREASTAVVGEAFM
jgi:nucleotide-binding universal stress UspA family protein